MISVGLPAYKARFLEDAINSVLKQTYSDFELIIVNDASPENIRVIVQKFDDPRIKYYENEKNLGRENTVENWNKVLSYAKGEFFVLFSDDDIYEPTFLEEMHALLIKYSNIDIAHCKVKIIDEGNNIIGFTPSCPEYESVVDFMWHRLKAIRTQFAPEFLVRTIKLKEIGGFVEFPLAWGSDDATWFKIAKERGIVFLNKPLCCWRQSNYNISSIGSVELRIKSNIVYNKWINDFLSDIKVTDEEGKFKVNEIKKLIVKWKIKNLSNLLIITSGHNILALFRIFINWLKFRRKYQLGKIILLRAIIFKLRDILYKSQY